MTIFGTQFLCSTALVDFKFFKNDDGLFTVPVQKISKILNFSLYSDNTQTKRIELAIKTILKSISLMLLLFHRRFFLIRSNKVKAIDSDDYVGQHMPKLNQSIVMFFTLKLKG